MSTEAPAAVEGPLSVDQAIGLLEAAPEETVEQPLEAAEPIEAEPTAELEDAPEEVSGDEPQEEGDPEAPAIAPPQSWAAEDRAVFQTLPREAQEVILARETERDRSTQKAVQEASDAVRANRAEAQGIAQLKAALEEIVPKAQKTFQDKWSNVDWVAWASQDPAAAQVGRFQYDAERDELARVESANQHAQQLAHRTFLAAEKEALATLAKTDKAAAALLDPAKGNDNRRAVAGYLIANGADPKNLEGLPAMAVTIAYKAYLYDQLNAGLKTRPATIPPARTAPVRPAAATQVRSPQREAEAISNRFAQTRGTEDAIALLDARSARKAS